SGDEVRVFTRNLHDATSRVPEIVETIRALPAESLILDGEAIALRPDGFPQPFQVTMRRFGRRLEVDAMRRELPLSAFFFDCLLRDGEAIAAQPAQERFAALREALPASLLIPRLVTAEAAEAARFLHQPPAHRSEGHLAQ